MRASAVRHVAIEHPRRLEPILRNMGFCVDCLDTAEGQALKIPLEEYQLLVVLGGYMGDYEEDAYPFLS